MQNTLRYFHFTIIQITFTSFTSLVFWPAGWRFIVRYQRRTRTSGIWSLSCTGQSYNIWRMPWLRHLKNTFGRASPEKFPFKIKRLFWWRSRVHRIHDSGRRGPFVNVCKFFGLLLSFPSCAYLFHSTFVLLNDGSDLDGHLTVERVHEFFHLSDKIFFVSKLQNGCF